ncbi:MAG: bifunctional 3-deoxy-7-phosphoheptulonate synthase/chorismate mutase [Candidatus Bruticola sp.]
MGGNQVKVLRSEIDKINLKILDLLNERATVALKLAKEKAKAGISGYDPVRESSMLEELARQNCGPFSDSAVREIFKHICQITLELMGSTERCSLKVSRDSHPENTEFEVNGSVFGGGAFNVVAGPCSIESEEQAETIAACLAKLGVKLMRGGAFKPRTSPYSFQGLGLTGLQILFEAAKRHNLSVVSEVTDVRLLDKVVPYIDIIQIGARSMYNYPLLQEVGGVGKPIILKRHFAASLEEFLLAAEYLMKGGASDIILCERGIRTFERWVRNTLDISALPLLKRETHLPIMADISHAAGRRDILLPLAKAVKAAGADALMVEVHNNPKCARSDSQQQLNLDEFTVLYQELLKN